MPTPPLQLLDVEAVSASFAGRVVLRDVSLALRPGDIVTVRGESGSGKSTLLRVLAGLVAIDAGRIVFEGKDIQTMAMPEYRTRVAYVPQSPRMFEGTVADNVRAGPGFRGRTLSDDLVVAALERASLSASFAPRSASELSGGEQLRVGLARALANEPRVLLLDEPTSALDPEGARHVTTRVLEFARAGNAVVAVTHVDEHARQLGGHSYSMVAGALRRADFGVAGDV